ncbi:MAG TPA: hypothetical protein VEM15_08410 [Thermodesulfobacteriota bacterium]|nr:hypothetical protein [Thermodesulfobacteriota bacterium]
MPIKEDRKMAPMANKGSRGAEVNLDRIPLLEKVMPSLTETPARKINAITRAIVL